MRASIIYILYYWFMWMHWLKYVGLHRKERLKNMCGATLEVAMLANVSLRCDFQCLPMCDWAPLTSSLPFDVLDSDWSTKHYWRSPWILMICCGLRVKMTNNQLLRYPLAFLIDGTVKLLLRGHPDERPPLLERQLDNINLNINVLIYTPEERPPLLKGQFFGAKQVASQEGFHCISNGYTLITVHELNHGFSLP